MGDKLFEGTDISSIEEIAEKYSQPAYDVSPGKASDVAYMAWTREGEITSQELAWRSKRRDSCIEELEVDEAEEALEALTDYGLIERSEDVSRFDRSPPTTGRYDIGIEDSFPQPGEKQPLDLPGIAFRKIGEMQQELDMERSTQKYRTEDNYFDPDLDTNTVGDI